MSPARASNSRIASARGLAAICILMWMCVGLLVAGAPRVSRASAPVPGPAPAISDDAEPSDRPAEVRIHKHGVFWIRASLDGESPAQRAREVVHELEEVLERELEKGERDLVEVRALPSAEQVEIVVNGRGVFTLGPADAEAAPSPSTMALARQLRMQLEEALHEERNRSALAGTVLSISLVVFLGLLLFLSLPKINEVKSAGEEWVRENGERLPHIKVRKVELLSVGALQNFLVLAVSAVGRVVQIICIYAYLVVCLSLFERTAPWVDELNGLVLSPFTTLLDRLQRVFPTATLTAAILLLLVPAWRITGQLARSVERGDVHLGWLPRDRVRPTVQLFRMGLVIAAVLVLGPLVSDDENSLVARMGTGALWALTLGAVPMVLTMLWGVVIVFGQTFKPGAWIEVGGRVGQIEAIELFFVVMRHPRREKAGATRYRIPHLWLAFTRVCVLPGRPRVHFEYPIPRAGWSEGLGASLLAALRALHTQGQIQVERMEFDRVVYRVEMPDDHRVSREHCYAVLERTVEKARAEAAQTNESSEPSA